DAVKPAGDDIRVAPEFAAGVQGGHDHLERGAALDRVLVDRDTAAVVGNANAAVVGQRDLDVVAEASQGLVDRVVHDLPDEVVEAAGACRPDIHARGVAARRKTLKNGERSGTVITGNACSHLTPRQCPQRARVE